MYDGGGKIYIRWTGVVGEKGVYFRSGLMNFPRWIWFGDVHGV